MTDAHINPPMTAPVRFPIEIAERLSRLPLASVLLDPRRYSMISAGDVLWLREPFKVLHKRDSGQRVQYRIAGCHRNREVTLPYGTLCPAPGRQKWVGAEMMPPRLSRMSLRVSLAQRLRPAELSMDHALSLGIDDIDDGFGCPMCLPGRRHATLQEAIDHLWFDGFLMRKEAPDEAMFAMVEVTTTNICKLVPMIERASGAR